MKCVELAPDLVPAKRSDVPNSEAKSAQVHFQGYANVLNTLCRLEASRKVDTARAADDYSQTQDVWSGGKHVASLGSEELVHCYENNAIFSAALTAYNKITGNCELLRMTGGFVSSSEFLSLSIQTATKMLFVRCSSTTKAKRR